MAELYELYGFARPREALIKKQAIWGQRTREALLEMNILLGQLGQLGKRRPDPEQWTPRDRGGPR